MSGYPGAQRFCKLNQRGAGNESPITDALDVDVDRINSAADFPCWDVAAEVCCQVVGHFGDCKMIRHTQLSASTLVIVFTRNAGE